MVLGRFQFPDTFCAYFSIFLYFRDLCTLAWSRSVGRRRPNRGWESSRLDSDSLAWEAPQQLAVLAPYGALSIGIEVLLAYMKTSARRYPSPSIHPTGIQCYIHLRWHFFISHVALQYFCQQFAVFLSTVCSIWGRGSFHLDSGNKYSNMQQCWAEKNMVALDSIDQQKFKIGFVKLLTSISSELGYLEENRCRKVSSLTRNEVKGAKFCRTSHITPFPPF